MFSQEYWDNLSKIITVVTPILTLLIAFYGISVWKKQLKGRNTYDLASLDSRVQITRLSLYIETNK